VKADFGEIDYPVGEGAANVLRDEFILLAENASTAPRIAFRGWIIPPVGFVEQIIVCAKIGAEEGDRDFYIIILWPKGMAGFQHGNIVVDMCPVLFCVRFVVPIDVIGKQARFQNPPGAGPFEVGAAVEEDAEVDPIAA
jgi:hypothetical protein